MQYGVVQVKIYDTDTQYELARQLSNEKKKKVRCEILMWTMTLIALIAMVALWIAL